MGASINPVGVVWLTAVIVSLLCGGVAAQDMAGQGLGYGPAGADTRGLVPGLSRYPLSPEQQVRIARIRQRTERNVRSLQVDSSLTEEQRAQCIAEARQAGHREVMDVLTTGQRAEFEAWWRSRTGADTAMGAGEGAGPAAPSEQSEVEQPTGVAEQPETCYCFPGLSRNPLSETQRQRISEIQRGTAAQVRAIALNRNITAEQRAVMISQVRADERERMLGLLTPEQVSEFNSYWGIGAVPAGVGAGPAVGLMGLRRYPLNAQQQQCIAIVQQQTAQRIQAVLNDPTLTDSQRASMMDQIYRSEREQVVSIFTPQQRQEFRDYWGMGPGTGVPSRVMPAPSTTPAPSVGAGRGAGPVTQPPPGADTSPDADAVPETGPSAGSSRLPATDVGPGLL